MQKEIDEAVDLYASEHPTASIFYLMRIAEYGLRALVRERSVTFKNKDLEWADWQDLISGIETSATKQWYSRPRGPEKDAAQEFYKSALSHFSAFKDKYRNAVMHVRKLYSDEEATSAMTHVREFMNGLSAKIGQGTRKPIRKWP